MARNKNKLARVKFTLLTNGLDFICSAVEHLSRKPSKRSLKYAILHLCAGVELVLKERLSQEHWSLVFEKPENANKKTYESGDFTSVSFSSCLKRLKDICGLNITDKQQQRLFRFRDKRNRLEHFGILDSVQALTAAAADVLSFVIDFIDSELGPKKNLEDTGELLRRIRKTLSDFEHFVEKRWKAIRKKVSRATTAVVTCPSCSQEAALLGDGISCIFCGHRSEAKVAADEYITMVLGENFYTLVKEGGEWPCYSCPTCENETMVDQGLSGIQFPQKQFICFSCGEAWEEGQLDYCGSCGNPYDPGDDGISICSDCFQAKVDRD